MVKKEVFSKFSRSSRKSQAAIEYLMVAGLAFLIVIPMIYLLYNYTSEVGTEVTEQKVGRVANEIINNAETMWYLGEPSRTTLRINMPENVVDIVISDEKDLVFYLDSLENPREVVTFGNVNLESLLIPKDMSPGRHNLKIEATKTGVVIYTGERDVAEAQRCAYNLAKKIMLTADIVMRSGQGQYAEFLMNCSTDNITAAYSQLFFNVSTSSAPLAPKTEVVIDSFVDIKSNNLIYDYGITWTREDIKGFDFVLMTSNPDPTGPTTFVEIETPQSGSCGDNFLNLGEECDDSNNLDGDGCSSDCNLEIAAVCGDAVVEGTEICDTNAQSCTTIDGYSGEQACLLDCSGYETTCTTTEACGDTIVNGLELCDGNTQACIATGGYPGTNACLGDCSGFDTVCSTAEACGDTLITGSEICDSNTQACTTAEGYAGTQACLLDCSGYETTCTTTEFCSDTIVNGNEECDDGNTNDLDGCSSLCEIECFPSVERIANSETQFSGGFTNNGWRILADDALNMWNGDSTLTGEENTDLFEGQFTVTSPNEFNLWILGSEYFIFPLLAVAYSVPFDVTIRDSTGTIVYSGAYQAVAPPACLLFCGNISWKNINNDIKIFLDSGTYTIEIIPQITETQHITHFEGFVLTTENIADFDAQTTFNTPSLQDFNIDDSANDIYTPPTNVCCGNFIIDTGETCDDGNDLDGDSCSSTCN